MGNPQRRAIPWQPIVRCPVPSSRRAALPSRVKFSAKAEWPFIRKQKAAAGCPGGGHRLRNGRVKRTLLFDGMRRRAPTTPKRPSRNQLATSQIAPFEINDCRHRAQFFENQQTGRGLPSGACQLLKNSDEYTTGLTTVAPATSPVRPRAPFAVAPGPEPDRRPHCRR